MNAPFQGPHVQPGDIVAVQMPGGELRTDHAAEAFAAEAAYNAGRINRGLPAVTTIATAVSEIDTLKAENLTLRDELDNLRNTDVGELAARCDELWAENQQLRAQLRRKS